jgi:hypothetical protein
MDQIEPPIMAHPHPYAAYFSPHEYNIINSGFIYRKVWYIYAEIDNAAVNFIAEN